MNFSRLCPVPRRGARDHRGFTLIELLVVITIIAVLAGLLLPVVSKVTDNAKKVETKSAAMQIVSAVKSYQTDYGTYPVPVGTTTDYTWTTGNNALFNVLRALNTDFATTGLNTRRGVYFEGNDAKSSSSPKSGFVPASATNPKGNSKSTGEVVAVGDYLDSWGNEYSIRIDSGYTSAVINPYYDNEINGSSSNDTSPTNTSQYLFQGVVVWTHGNDGILGSAGTAASPTALGDDVVSWQ